MTTPTNAPESAGGETLLPCPFCGSEDLETDYGYNRVYVRCQNPECYADGPITGVTKADGIAAWNRRSTPAAPQPERPPACTPGTVDLFGQDFADWWEAYTQGWANPETCRVPAGDAWKEAAKRAAPQPETEGMTFDEWLRMRDNGGDVIKQCLGNAETCGYACRGWGGHNDECLRAAWTAAKGGRS